MPLIRIDTTSKNIEKLDKISQAIHQALMVSFDFPENDFFQIVQSHDNNGSSFLRFGNYFDIDRDESIVFVQVFLRGGRPQEKKQIFYKKSAEFIQSYADIDPKNLFIVLTENTSADWSLGNGVAQYL